MRINEAMERNADNAGWAIFATMLGMLTAPHWLTQFSISIFTLVVGLVVTHFVKRELNRRWPHKKRENGE